MATTTMHHDVEDDNGDNDYYTTNKNFDGDDKLQSPIYQIIFDDPGALVTPWHSAERCTLFISRVTKYHLHKDAIGD